MLKIFVKKPLAASEGTFNLEVRMEVARGEFISLFGKSGAGKTTLLRMIAGLTVPQEGLIEVDGKVWFDSSKGINLPVQQRPIGFVFQEYSLFPHMTIRENLRYASKNKKTESLIDEYLQMTDLKGLEHQKPDKLSGGQKQRVALIRALMRNPVLLLLDEPLSALDVDTRLRLQDELLRISRSTGITTILVSHDLGEIFKLAGRAFIMNKGILVNSGRLQDILAHHTMSGKFKFAGEILGIEKDSVVNIIMVQIGQNITRVVATDEEIGDLRVGDHVMVSTKAFNPILIKFQC